MCRGHLSTMVGQRQIEERKGASASDFKFTNFLPSFCYCCVFVRLPARENIETSCFGDPAPKCFPAFVSLSFLLLLLLVDEHISVCLGHRLLLSLHLKPRIDDFVCFQRRNADVEEPQAEEETRGDSLHWRGSAQLASDGWVAADQERHDRDQSLDAEQGHGESQAAKRHEHEVNGSQKSDKYGYFRHCSASFSCKINRPHARAFTAFAKGRHSLKYNWWFVILQRCKIIRHKERDK